MEDIQDAWIPVKIQQGFWIQSLGRRMFQSLFICLRARYHTKYIKIDFHCRVFSCGCLVITNHSLRPLTSGFSFFIVVYHHRHLQKRAAHRKMISWHKVAKVQSRLPWGFSGICFCYPIMLLLSLGLSLSPTWVS